MRRPVASLHGLAATLLLAPSTYAKPTKCSRETNLWGKPVSCTCTAKTTPHYNTYVGICQPTLVGEENITIDGVLKTGVMAIGGETTGIVLTTDRGAFELVFPAAKLAEIQKLEGKKIQIQGKKFTLAGPERGKRTVIAVLEFSRSS